MQSLVVMFPNARLNKEIIFENNLLENEYREFIIIGKKEGVDVSISAPQFVSGGNIEKGFAFDGKWTVLTNYRADYVFDKLGYGRDRNRSIDMLSRHFKIINDPGMSSICDDKLLTVQTFPQYSPKTFKITKKNFKEIIKKVPGQRIVFKPRIGYGSRGVVIKDKSGAHPDDIGNHYIAQEYINTKYGIKGIQKQCTLRYYVVNGEIAHSVLEVAKEGEIVSGNAMFVRTAKADIPSGRIERIIKGIEKVFSKYHPRIYSVDFFVDKNKKVLVGEINSKPGLFVGKGEHKEDYDRIMRKLFQSLL